MYPHPFFIFFMYHLVYRIECFFCFVQCVDCRRLFVEATAKRYEFAYTYKMENQKKEKKEGKKRKKRERNKNFLENEKNISERTNFFISSITFSLDFFPTFASTFHGTLLHFPFPPPFYIYFNIKYGGCSL